MPPAHLSREFIRKFIEAYRSHPCLWKMKSPDYNTKRAKNEAYKKLIHLCKSVCPDADQNFVIRKINSLRGAFRKAYKKAQQCDSKEAHPKLWYYDLLLFVTQQDGEENSPVGSNNEESEDIGEVDEVRKPPNSVFFCTSSFRN